MWKAVEFLENLADPFWQGWIREFHDQIHGADDFQFTMRLTPVPL
jgi:hypothetical protein